MSWLRKYSPSRTLRRCRNPHEDNSPVTIMPIDKRQPKGGCFMPFFKYLEHMSPVFALVVESTINHIHDFHKVVPNKLPFTLCAFFLLYNLQLTRCKLVVQFRSLWFHSVPKGRLKLPLELWFELQRIPWHSFYYGMKRGNISLKKVQCIVHDARGKAPNTTALSSVPCNVPNAS